MGTDTFSNDFVVTVTVSQRELSAIMRGRLTATSEAVWTSQILEPIQLHKPHVVMLHGSEMTFCDGAGLGLIGEVRRAVSLRGGVVRFSGFSSDLQRLID